MCKLVIISLNHTRRDFKFFELLDSIKNVKFWINIQVKIFLYYTTLSNFYIQLISAQFQKIGISCTCTKLNIQLKFFEKKTGHRNDLTKFVILLAIDKPTDRFLYNFPFSTFHNSLEFTNHIAECDWLLTIKYLVHSYLFVSNNFVAQNLYVFHWLFCHF